MGSGIARNIQNTGLPLTLFNRTAEKMRPLVEAGATAAHTAREAAAAADIVVTNLMDDASVLGTVLGDNGILAGMRPGAIHIGTTTVSPSLSTRLAELHAANGSHYVAGPVAGRPDAAAAGKLFTFVAGKPEWLERCRPVMNAYANRIVPMGEDPAIAMSMKLVGNFMVASLIELIGEAYPSLLTGMFKQFMPAAEEYVDRICTRDFERAGFTLDGGTKDVTLILQAAAEVHAPLSYASVVRDKCLSARLEAWVTWIGLC
jgi:3-hydroxyisobutyrate dehydrogenase-like beta-hydroxyacid dehydrogenase